MTTTYRADHVGSLLRPPELLQAREDFQEGRITQQQLTEIEDRAIEQALQMQREVGMQVLTDGEYRRHDWVGDFTSSVDGYVTAEPPIRFEWRLPEPVATVGQSTMQQAVAEMPQQAGWVIGERLRLRHRLTEHEAPYMKTHANGVFKITMPATSYVVARGWKPGLTDKVYGSRWELCEDVARIMNDEVQWLAAQGVPYIQIDNAHYPDYIPEDRRDAWRAIGIDPDQALDEDIRADNLATRGLDRSKVILAITSAAAMAAAPGTPPAATSRSPKRSSAAWTSTASCSSTTLTGPAASSRCASCPRASRSSSAW